MVPVMMAGEMNLPAVRINTAERIIRFYLLDVRNIEYFFLADSLQKKKQRRKYKNKSQ